MASTGTRVRPFKVYPESPEQMEMFEKLRGATGFRNLGGLAKHLLMNECKNMTLVKNNLDKIKKESEGHT